MQKPKIGIYTQRYHYPVNTFILRQISGVQNSFEPIVLSSTKSVIEGPSPSYKIFEKEKNTFGRLYRVYKKITGNYVALSGSQMKFFERIITQNDIEFIHAHYGPSGIEIFPLAKKMKMPLLVSFHGYDASFLLRNQKYTKQLQELFEYARIIAVSNYMANKLIEAGAKSDNIFLLYYGVPVENKFVARKSLSEKLRNKEEIKFLQISGFEEKKGHIYTVQAFKEFLKYYSNCKLVFGGGGSLMPTIEKLCSDLELKEKILFLGAIKPDRVYDVMADSDIFLHHSVTAQSGDQEGIPNVIMEAMATGLPVISTFHSGIPELIDDGINGYLVEEKNIAQYTDKMKEALNSTKGFGMMARNKVVDKFNLQKQTDKLLEIYKKMIE